MKYDYTGSTGESTFQMTPPLLQPRRLWTPRGRGTAGGTRGAAAAVTAAQVKKRPARMRLHAFTIRGGFVNMADGERHMVIAGSMVKHREG